MLDKEYSSVDEFLEHEILEEDHLDVMLDGIDIERSCLDKMLDESLEDNLFYTEEDLLNREV